MVVGASENSPAVLSASLGCWLWSAQSQYQVMSITTAGNGPLTQQAHSVAFCTMTGLHTYDKNVLEDAESPTNFIHLAVSSFWSDEEKFSVLSLFVCLWCFCLWYSCNYLFHSPLFWMQSHSGWMSIQTEITRFSRSGISNEAASESLPQEYFLHGNFGVCFAEWCKAKSDLGGYLILRLHLISESPLFKIPGQ